MTPTSINLCSPFFHHRRCMSSLAENSHTFEPMASNVCSKWSGKKEDAMSAASSPASEGSSPSSARSASAASSGPQGPDMPRQPSIIAYSEPVFPERRLSRGCVSRSDTRKATVGHALVAAPHLERSSNFRAQILSCARVEVETVDLRCD